MATENVFNEAEQADSNEANDVDSITSSGDVTHNENTANAILPGQRGLDSKSILTLPSTVSFSTSLTSAVALHK